MPSILLQVSDESRQMIPERLRVHFILKRNFNNLLFLRIYRIHINLCSVDFPHVGYTFRKHRFCDGISFRSTTLVVGIICFKPWCIRHYRLDIVKPSIDSSSFISCLVSDGHCRRLARWSRCEIQPEHPRIMNKCSFNLNCSNS